MEEKKQSVRYLSLTERTVKLHRNLLVFSMAAMVLQAFDLRIDKASAAGFEVSNFDVSVLKSVFLLVIAYHALAYGSMLFEEFAQWRVTFRDKERFLASNESREISLLEELQGHLKSVKDNPLGLLTKKHADRPSRLEDIAAAVEEYLGHYKSFTRGALVRFWLIEVMFPYGAGLISILALFNVLPLQGVRRVLVALFA